MFRNITNKLLEILVLRSNRKALKWYYSDYLNDQYIHSFLPSLANQIWLASAF